jgi:hypothetical protein
MRRTLNDKWAGSSHFHLLGYDSIQTVYLGLAKISTYPVLDHVQGASKVFSICFLNSFAKVQRIKLKFGSYVVHLLPFFSKKFVEFGHTVDEIWLCKDNPWF